MNSVVSGTKFLKLKFSILQVTFWCSFGAFTSFAVAYMSKKGMSATLIGTMLATYTFCALCGQFFWGFVSDKLRTNKKVFILANILMLGMYFLVYFINGNFLIIMAYGFLGFVQTPIICNLDTWILKCYHNTPEEYGPIRACASLGYALFVVFYGRIIDYSGYFVMLIFSSVFVAMTVICALTTPDAPVLESSAVEKGQKNGSIKQLVTNKGFLFLLLILLITGVSSTPIMQMLPLVLENVKGTVVHQGYAMFASSLAQVPFMLLSRKLNRFTAYNRLLFSAFMYFVSLLLIAMVKSPELIILCCAINGVGFGILLPSMRQLVFENSPQGLYNTAQGLSDAVNSSFAGMISSTMAGLIIDSYGVRIMLLSSAGIQLVAMLLLIGRMIMIKKQNQRVMEMIESSETN